MEWTTIERIAFVRQRILQIQQARARTEATENKAENIGTALSKDFFAMIMEQEELLFNYSHLLIDY